MKNRRKQFLINRALQFRYVFYIVATLLIVSAAGMTSVYYGVWGSVLQSFSEEEVRDTMITAARIYEYNQARRPTQDTFKLPSVRMFKETVLLSERQKEIIEEILNNTHRNLAKLGLILIVFIGWGSIFLTHKVAGPLFRLNKSFEQVQQLNLTLRIQLRKWDEAKDVAAQFNQMVERLDSKISTLKKLAAAANNETLPQLRKELEEIKTSN